MAIETIRQKAAGLRRHRKQVVILAMIALACVVTFAWLETRSRNEDEPIRVSGNIEVTDAELSFKIPGRVETRLVDEGQTVTKGQTMALLDSRELSQEVSRNKAEVEAARAALSKLQAGSRPQEIAEARAAASQAQARLQELENGSRPQEIAAAQGVDAKTVMQAIQATRPLRLGSTELDAAAKALGMTSADLSAEIDAGKSLAVIASVQGVDVQTVQAAIQAARSAEVKAEIDTGRESLLVQVGKRRFARVSCR